VADLYSLLLSDIDRASLGMDSNQKNGISYCQLFPSD